MEAVRDEAQGVCPHAVEKLHKGEGEVKQEEAKQVARVGVWEDQTDPANRLLPPPGMDQWEDNTDVTWSMLTNQSTVFTFRWSPYSCPGRHDVSLAASWTVFKSLKIIIKVLLYKLSLSLLVSLNQVIIIMSSLYNLKWSIKKHVDAEVYYILSIISGLQCHCVATVHWTPVTSGWDIIVTRSLATLYPLVQGNKKKLIINCFPVCNQTVQDIFMAHLLLWVQVPEMFTLPRVRAGQWDEAVCLFLLLYSSSDTSDNAA